MRITVESSSNPGHIASKEEFEIFSGKSAGICYMKENFEKLRNESKEKTLKRANGTKISGHHSVFDHDVISLYLEDIPKALAMVLNNEKMYTTSEKSARYTKMKADALESELYFKWVDIFKDKIKGLYQEKYPDFFTDLRIEKLAQENARCIISVFTPTSMMYTVSYRQLNYIYGFMMSEIESITKHPFYEKLVPYFKEFCDLVYKLGFIDDTLVKNNKGRRLSLINSYDAEEYFGDVYITSYKISLACLAQAQRHRTISYYFDYLEKPEFYIPDILLDDEKLKQEWLDDMNKVKDNLPEGLLVKVTESGSMDNFILKMMERKCSFAQLEINKSTNEILNKYVKALKGKNHKRANEMEGYTHGARCTFKNFVCTSPCKFPLGIIETRKV